MTTKIKASGVPFTASRYENPGFDRTIATLNAAGYRCARRFTAARQPGIIAPEVAFETWIGPRGVVIVQEWKGGNGCDVFCNWSLGNTLDDLAAALK